MGFLKYKLRTMLITVLVFGVILDWVKSNIDTSRKENLLIAQLTVRNLTPDRARVSDNLPLPNGGMSRLGFYIQSATSFPSRIAAIFEPSTFERVTELGLTDVRYDDASIDIAEQFSHLNRLVVFDCTITSGRLARFRKVNPDVTVVVCGDLNEDLPRSGSSLSPAAEVVLFGLAAGDYEELENGQ